MGTHLPTFSICIRPNVDAPQVIDMGKIGIDIAVQAGRHFAEGVSGEVGHQRHQLMICLMICLMIRLMRCIAATVFS